MKKSTLILATAVLSSILYFGNISEPVASSFDGIVTDTAKKEKTTTKPEATKPTADTTKSK